MLKPFWLLSRLLFERRMAWKGGLLGKEDGPDKSEKWCHILFRFYRFPQQLIPTGQGVFSLHE